MKQIFFFSLLVLIFCSFFTGCENKTETSAGESIPIEDLENIMQTLACENFINCEVNFWATMFSTAQNCIDFMREEGTMDYSETVKAVNDGKTEYDEKRAFLCVEAMKEQGCKLFEIPVPEVCPGVFNGHAANGDDCDIDIECESRYCDISEGCPGKCAKQAEVGESCTGGDSSCVHGASCDGEKCIEFKGVIADGKSCSESVKWCSENSFCKSGKCSPKLEEGEDCSEFRDDCGRGMFCSPVGDDNVCVEGKIVDEKDAECNISEGSVCNFLNDLQCHFNYETFEGTCDVPREVDEECLNVSEKMYYQCNRGLYCKIGITKGTCVAQKKDGESCGEDNECLSEWCNEGKCENPEKSCTD